MNRESSLMVVEAFGHLTFFAQIGLVAFLLLLLIHKVNKKNKTVNSIISFFSDNSLSLAFFIALTATTGSLFFSEIAHFVPCKLCWFQRICMYPQVVLLGIAAVKNDFSIKKYIIPINIIGIIIATYHYLLQMSPLPLPCTDEIANCALKQVGYYGYITIPMMALTAFVWILVLTLLIKRK